MEPQAAISLGQVHSLLFVRLCIILMYVCEMKVLRVVAFDKHWKLARTCLHFCKPSFRLAYTGLVLDVLAESSTHHIPSELSRIIPGNPIWLVHELHIPSELSRTTVVWNGLWSLHLGAESSSLTFWQFSYKLLQFLPILIFSHNYLAIELTFDTLKLFALLLKWRRVDA